MKRFFESQLTNMMLFFLFLVDFTGFLPVVKKPQGEEKPTEADSPKVDFDDSEEEAHFSTLIDDWTIHDLFNSCNHALDALNACAHPKKMHLKMWGENGDQTSWADLRFFGPYISCFNSTTAYGRIEALGEDLPMFALAGIDRDLAMKNEPKNPDDDSANFLFIAIHRLSAFPFNIRATGPGYAYEVVVCHTFKNDGPVSFNYFVTIDKDRQVYLAEVLKSSITCIKDRRHHGFHEIPTSAWRRHDPFHRMMTDLGNKKALTGTQLAVYALNSFVRESCNFCIRASDHRGVVNFGIPMASAKRLFKDRIKVKTARGRTKPIMHWVIAHRRINGSDVRTHLRGLREFTWKGMDIEIFLPGKHRPIIHNMVSIVDVKSSNNWAWIFNKIAPITEKNPYSGEEFQFFPFDDVSKTGSLGFYYAPSRKQIKALPN